MSRHGFATLEASGKPVGLDEGQVGNSEVGHLTLGAGFIIPSTLSRIQAAYRDGTWAQLPLWRHLSPSRKLHIVGLLSDAGVHGHIDSLTQAAMLAWQHGIADIIVHPVLDGVDSQAGSAPALLDQLRRALQEINGAKLGVITGRRWFADRSGKLGVTRSYTHALTGGLDLPCYHDEALRRHLLAESEASFIAHAGSEECRIGRDEPVLLTQHRADRAVQVARVLAESNPVYSLVELGESVPKERVFFPTQPLTQGLGFEFKQHKLNSVRISESCKFPHVTYFLNGLNRGLEGIEICVDSIAETEFAAHPEMSIAELRRNIVQALRDPGNNVVLANIPNLDQVGHLGRYDTAAKAAEHVDAVLKDILAVCRETGWTAIVTSDHGNADRMIDEAGRPFGSHTERPVPCTVIPAPGAGFAWRAKTGSLANVAPTLLTVLGLPQPAYMTKSLIEPVPAAREQTPRRGTA
jgi:2,3-bisphosphoglycerate-independent phosphoglycerate mutase